MKVYVVIQDSGLGDGLIERVVLVTADEEEAKKTQATHEYSYFIEEHEVQAQD